jgi:hypothetical protein
MMMGVLWNIGRKRIVSTKFSAASQLAAMLMVVKVGFVGCCCLVGQQHHGGKEEDGETQKVHLLKRKSILARDFPSNKISN